MLRPRSLGWPITLAVVMIVLLVLLIVGWVVLTIRSLPLLMVGAVLLALVLAGVVAYMLISISEIRLNQRQSNFMASVTHELKSPLASLKLYLQTLVRHNVSEQQQADFCRSMIEDVNRLDALINHLLDAARVDQEPLENERVEVDLAAVLRSCATAACLRYHVPPENVELNLVPGVVWARPLDIEMLFRNLIDNALKYAGDPPWVGIESRPQGRGRVITRISDNGPGIPADLRRKIFGRFVRAGNELERSKPGTGLGLFIVRTLARRLRGRVSVSSRVPAPGTVFEVELPGEPALEEEPAAAGALPQQG
jgi:signal transduction histidine kinase